MAPTGGSPLMVKTEPPDSGSPLNSSLSPTKSAMDDKVQIQSYPRFKAKFFQGLKKRIGYHVLLLRPSHL